MNSKISRSFIFVALTAALASSLSLLGGLGLEYIADKILPLVPLIIALPALNDLVGDYAAIIAAHVGDPSERTHTKKQLAKSILKVLFINIIAIIILSLLTAKTRGYIATSEFIWRFVFFVAVASVITILSMFLLAQILDKVLLKRKINPDELLIPIVTSLADIVMLLLLTLAVLTIF